MRGKPENHRSTFQLQPECWKGGCARQAGASLGGCRVSRCDRGKKTGNSVPGSGNSMDHGLEWVESGPDESLKGRWGGWSPGGQTEAQWGERRCWRGRGTSPPPPEPIGRVTNAPLCPPGVVNASFFSPVFPSLDQQLHPLLFHETQWGIWLFYSKS